MIEQQEPLALLDFPAQTDGGRSAARGGRFAEIDEMEMVPTALFRQQPAGGVERMLGGQRSRRHQQVVADGVLAHSAKPILGVGVIRLAAVQNAVPIAAFDRRKLLA